MIDHGCRTVQMKYYYVHIKTNKKVLKDKISVSSVVAAAQLGGLLKLWVPPRSATESNLIGSGLCHREQDR